MNNRHIILADENIYKICKADEALHGELSFRRVGREQGCSYETIRRRYYRHELCLRYKDIFDALPYRIAIIVVNTIMRTKKKSEAVDRTTLHQIFKMTDRQLKRFPMMGKASVKIIREVQKEYEK